MSADWTDLRTRLLSALVLGAVSLGLLALGGAYAVALVAVLAAAITWEVIRMTDPAAPGAVRSAVLAGGVIVAVWLAGPWVLLPFFGAVALVSIQPLCRGQGVAGISILAILTGSYAFLWMRNMLGFDGILWLVAVIVASDVLGYFAGRALGGPKFWPTVSPKKTWSGTLAGWAGAAGVGAAMAPLLGAGPWLVPVSVVVAFSGQMGDIAESAFKRRMGVKDSSQLIPGHGGAWDRFDAMLGGALVCWVLWLCGLLPVAA